MNKFYPQRGSRSDALKSGIEYNSFDDLKKIVDEIFYSGDVRIYPLSSVSKGSIDKDYTHMVTLNYNAIGFAKVEK